MARHAVLLFIRECALPRYSDYGMGTMAVGADSGFPCPLAPEKPRMDRPFANLLIRMAAPAEER